MSVSTLTTKGQVTLPKPIRDALHLQTGDVVDFVLTADGRVELRKAGRRVEELFGMLYDPGAAAADDRTLDDDLGTAITDEGRPRRRRR